MIPAPSEDKVASKLTLVIFGDPDAVEPGPNLLLAPDKEHEPFSSMLYDLCGRVIEVFDFLSLKNTDHFPSDKGVDAFLLLLPYGHSVSQYEASVQWLKSSFGEGALDYLMTVVTLESEEQCEGAMAYQKDFSHFSAKRSQVCSKNLSDAGEINSLVEKIGIMVSDNDIKCYSRTQKEEPGQTQGGHDKHMKDQDQNRENQDQYNEDQNMKDQGQNTEDQDLHRKDRDPNREDQTKLGDNNGDSGGSRNSSATQQSITVPPEQTRLMFSDPVAIEPGPNPLLGPNEEGPGTKQEGPGPKPEVPGTKQEGSGPEQEEPDPKQEGPGPAHGRPGRKQEVPGPKQEESCPKQGGPRPKEKGPGPKEEGPGPKHRGPGLKQEGPDTEQEGPGPKQEEPGPKQEEPGPKQEGTGHKQEGPGPKQEGPGPEQGGAGPAKGEPGRKQEGPGPKLEGPGPNEEWPGPKQGGPKKGGQGPKKEGSGPKEEEPGPEIRGPGPKQDGPGPKQGPGAKEGGFGPKELGPGPKQRQGPQKEEPSLKQKGTDPKQERFWLGLGFLLGLGLGLWLGLGPGLTQAGEGPKQGGEGLAQIGQGPEWEKLSPKQERTGPKQEGPYLKQGGPGPKQGGPGAEEEGSGPKDEGPGPKQEEAIPKQEEPEPKQEGTGLKQERPGPKQEGPGPAQGEAGPVQGGPGCKQEGPGPKQGGPGPNEEWPGPKQGGPAQGGPGPKQQGPGPKQGGQGLTQGGQGSLPGGPGLMQGGEGPKQGGPGPKQEGTGSKQEGPDLKQGRPGPKEKGSGPKDEGPEPKHRQPRPKQEGPGPKQDEPSPKQEGMDPKQEGFWLGLGLGLLFWLGLGSWFRFGPGLTEGGEGPKEEWPGPKQGGPAQGGPGPKMEGPGPKQEGPGPKQEGPGPRQGGPGLAQGGLGSKQGGIRPKEEGQGPKHRGPRPKQGGPGPTLGGPVAQLFTPSSEKLELIPKLDGDEIDAGCSGADSESQPSNTDEQAEESKRMGATMKPQNALLSRLTIHNRLETKLNSAEFHQIRPALKNDKDVCESDLVSVYLYKLLMLDYGARYVEAKQEPSGEKQSKEQHGNEEEDDDSFFNKKVVSKAQSQQSNIHPLDLQMAVFHCSDDFLKQKIVTKLSQCQYALPLLVPDPFTGDIECPLWTFIQIKKTWKKTETKDNIKVVTMKSMPIYKAETPMVFCFRLGSLSVSKSQLINTLINDRHNTFFHRNCPGSTKSRLLFDGVVEITWYCPAGRSSDTFTDCVAFCNLHGDGLIHDKQLKIMMDKASVNVVFVPTLKKDPVISALLKSPQPLIVLVGDDAEGAEEMKKNKYRVGLKERSLSDISKELKNIISDTLSFTNVCFQLELTRDMATMDSGIRVDENNIFCESGFSAATDVTKTFETADVYLIKSKFLPCQGELWHEWGRLNKDQYRLKGDVEKEKGNKQTEMRKLREEQCKTACSELVESFVKHLSSLPLTEREYFLKWTQILMDAHATDCLSSILQSYDQVWSEVLDLKKKNDKTNDLQSKQKELTEISKNLHSATFGLEHIFREMCQIYEAHKSLKKEPENEPTDWSKYPELAAELMISGHPMELMDGDAGQVPITWIASLIDQVILKLGDKRVFVLSVLGIQSSGKSTMLNAMFGLQFAVSAGRCTRGAFMQLVKLSDEIRKMFKWDYILVVDTEGLRALELDGNATIHHDNELATFVVGVGNITLVNIFGEHPSDMQDVLQIVVQAFMRMKEVKLSPSCVFVHQNVTDVGAAEKNMDGKRKLQEKLDQMVQLAAKEEVCDAESFSDIIEFDVQKDVKYFAQLWEGSPPMAPPNPGYSESVQELRSFILSKAAESSGVTLSEFKTKVKDLWDALLNENFVFSFRNTLEIAVYRKLEVQYSNWTWSLRQEMLRIEEQLYTRIENGSVDQVDLNYLLGEIGKKYSEIRNNFEAYFDGDKDKEMLVQWRHPFELKIKDVCDELVCGLNWFLDVIEQKKAGKRLDEKKTMFENTLLQKSKELAHKLRDKAKDEDELRKQFNRVWEDWVSELTQGTKPIENANIANDVFSVLQQLGFESSLIHNSKTSKTYKDFLMHRDYSHYVGQKRQKQKQKNEKNKGTEKEGSAYSTVTGFGKRVYYFLSGTLPQDTQNQIRDHIQAVEKEALQLIKSKPVETRGYNSSYLYDVASYVITRVADFESNCKYSFKKEFTVDLILYVFDSAEGWISKSHDQYIKNTDIHTYLESKRNEYYSVFSSFCRGSSSAVVLAEVICEKLKASMTEAVRNRTAIDVAGHMKENYPGFNESRLNLEKHVLKSLAEKEDFKRYKTYIYKPHRYIETFIQDRVHDYVTGEENVSLLIKKNVEVIETVVYEALYKATEKVQEGDVTIWLQEFDNLIKEKLTAVSVSSQHFSDVNRFDFLKDAIEKGLIPIIRDLKKLPPTEINEARMKPDQMLIDQLCNCCWETCPFCSAVCTNTVKGHSPDKHCVPYHRPAGIKGVHKINSVELVKAFCTTLVTSDQIFYPNSDKSLYFPCKQYQTAGGKYAEWQITPNGSMLVYWKWFVCHFQKELEAHHMLKFQGREIPREWRNYSKEEAIESLEEMYNM